MTSRHRTDTTNQSAAYCSNVFYDANYYCTSFNNAISKANKMVSIPYLISAIISPFLGIFVDRFGLRAVMATISPVRDISPPRPFARSRSRSCGCPSPPVVSRMFPMPANARVWVGWG